MNLSANANIAQDRGKRILRGVQVNEHAAVLSQQLEPCAPGDPNSVDPRLRDRSIEEGMRTGFEQGYQEGMSAAQAQVQQQLDELQNAAAALTQAANEFRQREIDLLSVAEEQIIDGVFAIAEAVLQHEISLKENPGRDAIKRALALAPNGTGATAYLNPTDVERLGESQYEAEGRTIRIVADAQIERGGAILEIGPTRIDTQLTTALERMREVL